MLHRQVQVVHQLRHAGVDVDQPLRELVRVAGGVADARDTRDSRDRLDEQREVGDFVSVARVAHNTHDAHSAAVGVDVLAQQRHFLHALRDQAGDFGQHVVQWPVHFFTARVGHHAVRAVLRAAFHDRHEGRSTLGAGGRQVVELLDLGEADVHLRALLAAPRGNHLRQPVQGLRAEDQVDIGRAFDQRRAFLAGHAATHTDQHALLFKVLDAAQVAEHLFLRLLAHRAGIEQNQVGLLDVGRRFVAIGGMQHVNHLARVVVVHLAAEGADEHLLGRLAVRVWQVVHGRLQVCVSALKRQRCACSALAGQGLRAASAGVSSHTSSSSPLVSSV